ncbi:MAG: DUF4041 domain-containing protein [Deltaproteobacteria bacterium]|nr:DUF4041 domain-containing protein [Deltaproteobacteria bacterium]
MIPIVLAVVSIVALAALAYYVYKAWRADNALAQVQEQNRTLQQKVSSLAKYEGIADAENRIAVILDDAQRRAAEVLAGARREAETLLAGARGAEEKAEAETEEQRAQALARVKEAKLRADTTVANANAEATRIVEAAKSRAQEIAGDAYAAMERSKELEQAVKALKNVIEGYGDQYLVPTFSLLDELAEEFGFAEAGKKLKEARERVRQMVKNGTAATCDYVEENRRTTAVAFVTDAFNGKVDSVLSEVRNDNYGMLEQKIKDAFGLVNFHGRAFRDARIRPEYLQARLGELRWATIVHELKLKEREEQRQIKERIREEEKAQREFERAMKDAEKEEDMLRKAMDKVQRDVAKASDEQKAKYEQQLLELTEKLRAAEEKNQRALSMAQQTRAGHVYVISNVGSFGDNVYKIGLTRRLEPMDRVKELGDASVPFDFDVHAMIRCDDAPALETALHKRFLMSQVNKVNPKKEFFRTSIHDVRAEVERLGHQASWTMAAACRDYKETQAIERSMTEKTLKEGAWAAAQMKEHDVAMRESVAHEAAE